jgi:hypothetical protein
MKYLQYSVNMRIMFSVFLGHTAGNPVDTLTWQEIQLTLQDVVCDVCEYMDDVICNVCEDIKAVGH